jgi:DnaK suppressor protein
MSAVDPNATAALLQRRLEAIDAALVELAARSAPVELDQTLQGRLSRLDAMGQQQMAQASSAHLRQERLRIEAALARIDGGRYGLCCRCGEAIAAERLRAEPSAALCLDCLDEVQSARRDQARAR